MHRGKNLKDRTVFLTDMAVSALQDYLAVRGPGASDHVFLYRNQVLRKNLVRAHIQLAGQAVGRERYTFPPNPWRRCRSASITTF